ncbi:MAG: hypothetical protein WC291_12010 [Thermodesulfovibrionales bacterium]|jgi:hypothetical protein
MELDVIAGEGKRRRRGFDTGQEQYVRGEKYDPRNQWGSGPFERTSSVESSSRIVYPDLPFGGYFMSGEQIAQAGPDSGYSPPRSGGGMISKGSPAVAPQSSGKVAASPVNTAMARLVQGIEESAQVQKNLLARYKPATLRERSFFA